MEPQLPCCLVCSNRGCCQSHSDPAILQGSEGRGQWGDAGIVGRCGVNRPGPVTCPTWKQKVVTSSPGKFSDASKVADLDFRSMVRRHLSYNSLSSWRAERDTEDMRSFCYLGENRGERWPQSRVIGAFQRHGIWITMLTMWRHPVTPGKTTKTRKLLPVNLEIFDFVTDTGEVTGWVAAGRVTVDGGGAVPAAWDFHSSSEWIPQLLLVTVRFGSYCKTKASLARRGPKAPIIYSRWKGHAYGTMALL